MKKTLSFMVMAFALLFAQCRKPEVKFPTPSAADEGTTVSMTVTAGPGSKTDITTAGGITWSTGDKLYVGYDSKYIGCLTLQGAGGSATGTFSGDVTLTGITDGEKTFHFFYLGSVDYTGSLKKGESTTVDVDFSSQNIYADVNNKLVSASKHHVGYGSANGTVKDGVVTGINVTLVSKVALARFSFTKNSEDYTDELTLSGDNIYNSMTVGFGGSFNHGTTPGSISLTGSHGERYVMLVPTGATTAQTLTFTGSAEDGTGDVSGLESNKFYGKTEPIPVNLTAPAPTHEYVDLGLSVKWATCNLGAEHPYDYGDYYAWGATETWYSAGGQSESPTWKDGYSDGYTWAHCPGNGENSGYNADAFNAWKVDNLTNNVLNPEVDAAHANWGEPWRMPTGGTDGEWQELMENTYMKWEYDYASTGVPGFIVYKVKDAADEGLFTVDFNEDPEVPEWVTYDQDWNKAELKGEYSLSDVHLFLPAAGYRSGSSLNDAGSIGHYWSSSLSSNPIDAYRMGFRSGEVYPQYNSNTRYLGCPVRPVYSPQN